jgi:hypothetical protein
MLADSLRYQPWSAHPVRHAVLASGIALVVVFWAWARRTEEEQAAPRADAGVMA